MINSRRYVLLLQVHLEIECWPLSDRCVKIVICWITSCLSKWWLQCNVCKISSFDGKYNDSILYFRLYEDSVQMWIEYVMQKSIINWNLLTPWQFCTILAKEWVAHVDSTHTQGDWIFLVNNSKSRYRACHHPVQVLNKHVLCSVLQTGGVLEDSQCQQTGVRDINS